MYEPGVLGLPDKVKGPTYSIENDSLVPFSPNLEHLPHLGDTLLSHRDHVHHHHHDNDTDDDIERAVEDW